MALLGSPFGPAAGYVHADQIQIGGGSLTLNLNGDAFANGADAAYLATFNVNLTAGQTFMEYARHFTPAQASGLSVLEFRPQPSPPVVNFNDLRAGWVRPPSDGLLYGVNDRALIGPQPPGRAAVPTTFAFDPLDITGTATGVIGTTGATSFWYSNQAMIDTGSVWLAFGDLTLEYDSARAVGGNSGWYFSNTLLFPFTLFDTRNVTVGYNGGLLSADGDLVVSQELRDGYALQAGLNVGSFQLAATAVPEPGSLTLLATGGLSSLGWFSRRRRRYVG